MKKVIFGMTILIVIFIFLGLIISIKNGIELSKVNSMYEDIETIEDKIALYYLNYGYIPIKDKVNFENSINPNDSDGYYEIDLDKLDNIYLNYGQKSKDENDFYIINDESHTIYYFKGIEYKNENYYTKDINYTLVEQK